MTYTTQIYYIDNIYHNYILQHISQYTQQYNPNVQFYIMASLSLTFCKDTYIFQIMSNQFFEHKNYH